MRYIIYGAGAIGSGIGGHLWRTGHEALLVGRPGHVGRIREAGLRLITGDAEYRIAVPAVADARDIGWRSDDVVLLCVKSQDTENALREVRAAGADTASVPLLCCQNSITNEPIAVRYFGRVYGVLVVVPGVYVDDGVVYNPIRGNAGWLEIGRYPRGLDELAETVSQALREASYESTVHPDVMLPKAAKLLGNLGNAFGAVTDARDDVGYMQEVRREGEAALGEAGIRWEDRAAFDVRARAHRGTTALPPGLRNLGSSWQSLVRRQGSIEADFLNGEVVRLGRIHGVPTPYNAVLQRIANEMAVRCDRPGKYTPAQLLEMGRNEAG